MNKKLLYGIAFGFIFLLGISSVSKIALGYDMPGFLIELRPNITKYYSTYNITGGKNGTGYLYNNETHMMLNETKMNKTISDIAADTNCSGSGSCPNIIYWNNESGLDVNSSVYLDGHSSSHYDDWDSCSDVDSCGYLSSETDPFWTGNYSLVAFLSGQGSWDVNSSVYLDGHSSGYYLDDTDTWAGNYSDYYTKANCDTNYVSRNNWGDIDDYPSGCNTTSFVRVIGDALVCAMDKDTDTNTQLTEEQVEDFVGGMLGGTETDIAVTYQDETGDIDFVVSHNTTSDLNTTGMVTIFNRWKMYENASGYLIIEEW